MTSLLALLLSGEFARWMVLANFIAWPGAYYIMILWLRNFVYRTDIGIGPFLFSAIVMLGLTGLTVSYHAIKSAIARPVDALRHE